MPGRRRDASVVDVRRIGVFECSWLERRGSTFYPNRPVSMETALVHGTSQKITDLLLFDPLGDTHTQQALLRWTGVYPTYATYPAHAWQWHQDRAPAPRKLRYSNDPAVDGRIAADVNQLQRKPLPAPGEQSRKHGRCSARAIQNIRLPKLDASMTYGLAVSVPVRSD